MLKAIRAIILDFDGVIVDSHSIHVDAWEKAHRDFFNMELPQKKALIGRAGVDIARSLAENMGAGDKSQDLYHYKTRLVHEAYKKINLLPGVREFIVQLQKKGIPFAIGSNARSVFITKLLALHGITAPIIVGFDHVENPKPHPEPFLKCAENMGVAPVFFHEVAVFDDSPIGISAAQTAGMIAIGVEGQLTAAELRESGAHFTVENLQDALELGWLS